MLEYQQGSSAKTIFIATLTLSNHITLQNMQLLRTVIQFNQKKHLKRKEKDKNLFSLVI